MTRNQIPKTVRDTHQHRTESSCFGLSISAHLHQTNVTIAACERMTFPLRPLDLLSSGRSSAFPYSTRSTTRDAKPQNRVSYRRSTGHYLRIRHAARGRVYHLPCESIIPGTCSSSMRCIIGCKDAKPQPSEPSMS